MRLYLFLMLVMLFDLKGDEAIDMPKILNSSFERSALMNNERAKRQLNSNAKNVDEQCEDLHENCGRWASRDYCQNDDFKRFMSMKCRRSCKLCGEARNSEDPVSPCVDKTENCDFWAGQRYCTELLYTKFMEANCPRSCKSCPEESELQKSTTTAIQNVITQLTKQSENTSKLPMSTTVDSATTAGMKDFDAPPTMILTTPASTTAERIITKTEKTTASTTTARAKTTPSVTLVPESTTIFTTSETKITTPITTKEASTPMKTTRTTAKEITTPITTRETSTSMKTSIITTKQITTPPTEQTTVTTSSAITTPLSLKISSTTAESPVKILSTLPQILPTIVSSIQESSNLTSSLSSDLTKLSLGTVDTILISSSSSETILPGPQTLTTSANKLSTSLTSTTSSCLDRFNSCSFLAFFCQKSRFAQNNCKASCGLCPQNTTESTRARTEKISTKRTLDMTTFTSAAIPSLTSNLPNSFTTVKTQESINSSVSPSQTEKATLPSLRASIGTVSFAKPTYPVTYVGVTLQSGNFQMSQQTTPTTIDPSELSASSSTALPFRTTATKEISFRTTRQANYSRSNECEDGFKECTKLHMFCDHNINVRNNCKKTCALCDDETMAATTLAATFSVTTPSNEICEDTFSKCVELMSECQRPESTYFLRQTCRRTCGFCDQDSENTGSLPEKDNNGCSDDQDVCETWSQSGFCDSAIYPELKQFMEKNCRYSCKLCDVTKWSQWTSCSLSCGGGEQTRTKTICRNETCSDPIKEIRFCSLEVCPNNPNVCEDRMSQRSCRQYKEKNACDAEVIRILCNATCGLCAHQASHDSDSSFPMTGEWQPWGAWSLCNATCNGGFQTRNRSCLNPPCNGSAEDNTACNTFRCHSCYDQSSNCRTMEDFGACRKIVWKLYCKVTCGLCRPAPIEGRCADTNSKCSVLARRCSHPSVAHSCPVTCGRCAPPTEPPTTTVSTVTKPRIDGLPKICADKHVGCAEAPKRNLCQDRKIAAVCPSSCGQCRKKLRADDDSTDSEFVGSAQCADKWDFCSRLAAGCENSSFIQENCPVACNVCSAKKSGSECVDQNSACSILARYGQCSNPIVVASCRLSCDSSCTQTSTLWVSTTVVTPSATPSCVDGNEGCPKYHALGQCSNDFIRFLCPFSCQACGEKRNLVVAPPQCQDKMGQICILFQSQCSFNSILQYGCEKTCGVCKKTAEKCEDVLENECQALGREGMCAMANFRNRCPATCGVCDSGVSTTTDFSNDDERTAVTCFDQHRHCDQLRGLCDREPMIRTICRKTCGICGSKSSQTGYPCVDINPERCPRLQILGQCSSNSAVAFMCAKSCGKCVSGVANCKDSYATCESFKQYCSLRSIQLQCARTCGVCGIMDQERTNAGVEIVVSNMFCGDFIDECSNYKSYCGLDEWLYYMDTMCPKSCGACGLSVGTWTKWSSWSECSKSCNDDPGPLNADSGGNRTRSRQCIDGNYCEGGQAASVDIGKCNKDKCPELQEEVACVDQLSCTRWKNQGRCRIRRFRLQMQAACPIACGYCIPDPVWTAWGECDSHCGLGQQYRTLKCNYDKCKQTKQINTTEIRNCTIRKCDGWTTWSLWSRCSSTCGVGSRLRIRSCKDGDVGGFMCRGSYLSEEVCGNNRPCASWSAWSSWESCSLTCGSGTKSRNRTCQNASEQMTCEGPELESDSCNEWSCFEWTEWGSWSECSLPCGGSGSQTRFRKCPDINESCGKKSKAWQERVCGTEKCSSWTEWSNWSDCSVTCGAGGTYTKTRTCRGGSSEMCVGNSVEQSECVSKQACIRWSNWSEYGECSATCGGGFSIRTRVCSPTRLDGKSNIEECPGSSIDRILCNCGVCPDVGVWSPWGDFSSCTATCGGGEKIRRRLCLNGIPGRGGCQGPSHNTADCGQEQCLIGKWDSWTTWSHCSVSCGTGIKTKDRNCLDGNEGFGGCSGNSEKMERCNTHRCPYWSAWGLWSGCSDTCGSSGIRIRTKSCYDEYLNETVLYSNCPKSNITLENETCNAKDCPTWAPWGLWTECSASCGVGFSIRKRGCQNGLVGNLGCHENYTAEKSFCNEWDCPPVCSSVPLNMKWNWMSYGRNVMSLNSDTPWSSDFRRLKSITIKCLSLTTNSTNRWLQISFQRPRLVSGISMKGFQNLEIREFSWVKKFLVLYGNAPDTFKAIYDNSGRPRLFYGSNGPIDTVYRYWEPIRAMYWKVQVLESQPTNWVCMESELYRCKNNPDNFQGEVDEISGFGEGSGKA